MEVLLLWTSLRACRVVSNRGIDPVNWIWIPEWSLEYHFIIGNGYHMLLTCYNYGFHVIKGAWLGFLPWPLWPCRGSRYHPLRPSTLLVGMKDGQDPGWGIFLDWLGPFPLVNQQWIAPTKTWGWLGEDFYWEDTWHILFFFSKTSIWSSYSGESFFRSPSRLAICCDHVAIIRSLFEMILTIFASLIWLFCQISVGTLW